MLLSMHLGQRLDFCSNVLGPLLMHIVCLGCLQWQQRVVTTSPAYMQNQRGRDGSFHLSIHVFLRTTLRWLWFFNTTWGPQKEARGASWRPRALPGRAVASVQTCLNLTSPQAGPSSLSTSHTLHSSPRLSGSHAAQSHLEKWPRPPLRAPYPLVLPRTSLPELPHQAEVPALDSCSRGTVKEMVALKHCDFHEGL